MPWRVGLYNPRRRPQLATSSVLYSVSFMTLPGNYWSYRTVIMNNSFGAADLEQKHFFSGDTRLLMSQICTEWPQLKAIIVIWFSLPASQMRWRTLRSIRQPQQLPGGILGGVHAATGLPAASTLGDHTGPGRTAIWTAIVMESISGDREMRSIGIDQMIIII